MLTPLPPRSTLFPYTTLFRSWPCLPIGFSLALSREPQRQQDCFAVAPAIALAIVMVLTLVGTLTGSIDRRSEEHTSELQSRGHLVCRLLLEKKNVHEFALCAQ